MIVMSYLVRNEADVIALNIDHHLAIGVDRILVYDNGSTDGTLEILEEYQRMGVLELTAKGNVPLDQRGWRGQMVHRSIALGADWVMSNDADEFYHVEDGKSLRRALDETNALVVNCRRRNMVGACDRLSPETWQQELRFWSRGAGKKPDPMPEHPDPLELPFFYYDLPGKVVFRPVGFKALPIGAHNVVLKTKPRVAQAPIMIRHYPVRDPKRFLNSIPRFAQQVQRPKKNANTSGKYHRWMTMLDSGISPDVVLAEALPTSERLKADLAEGRLREPQPASYLRAVDAENSETACAL